jgi:hypothetical protein
MDLDFLTFEAEGTTVLQKVQNHSPSDTASHIPEDFDPHVHAHQNLS